MAIQVGLLVYFDILTMLAKEEILKDDILHLLQLV